MQSLPSLRLTAHLNAVLRFQVSVAEATAAVVADDVAHHVVDPDHLLGLDPLAATPLAAALPAIAAWEPEMWVLALPVPGALAPLRGPTELNRAALEVGEAVVAVGGGLALVPHAVGRGVQWRAFPAEHPFAPASSYDAERALSEAVLRAAEALTRLDVAAGTRPHADGAGLAPGYSPRQRVAADRAARLLLACDSALSSDGAALSAHEAGIRASELRRLRAAAADALCAAASWMQR
nr:hypothetical protein [uncultured Friedmanniella sp.]